MPLWLEVCGREEKKDGKVLLYLTLLVQGEAVEMSS